MFSQSFTLPFFLYLHPSALTRKAGVLGIIRRFLFRGRNMVEFQEWDFLWLWHFMKPEQEAPNCEINISISFSSEDQNLIDSGSQSSLN